MIHISELLKSSYPHGFPRVVALGDVQPSASAASAAFDAVRSDAAEAK